MKFDGINLINDSSIENFKVESGTAVDRGNLTNLNGGELFYQTDGTTGIYKYVGGDWTQEEAGSAGVNIDMTSEDLIIGTNYVLHINDYSISSTYAVSIVGAAPIGTVTLYQDNIYYTSRAAEGIENIIVTRDGTSVVFAMDVLDPAAVDNEVSLYHISGNNLVIRSMSIHDVGSIFLVGTNTTTSDGVVIRVNELGEIQWSMSYTDRAFRGSGLNNDGTKLYVGGENTSTNKSFVAELDITNGNILNEIGLDTTSSIFYAVVVDSTGSVYCGGRSTSNAFFVKFDSTLSTLTWQTRIVSDGDDSTIFDMYIRNDGTLDQLYIAGNIQDLSRRGLYGRFDTDGNKVWLLRSRYNVAFDNNKPVWKDLTSNDTHMYAVGSVVVPNEGNTQYQTLIKFDFDGNTVFIDRTSTGAVTFKSSIGEGIAVYNGTGYLCGRNRDNDTGPDDFVLLMNTFNETTQYNNEFVHLSDVVTTSNIPLLTSVYHNQLTSLVYSGWSFRNGDLCGIMITNNDSHISINPGSSVPVIGLTDYDFNNVVATIETGLGEAQQVFNVIDSIGATIESVTTITYSPTVDKFTGQY